MAMYTSALRVEVNICATACCTKRSTTVGTLKFLASLSALGISTLRIDSGLLHLYYLRLVDTPY